MANRLRMSSDIDTSKADAIDATLQILLTNSDVDFNPCVATLSKLVSNILNNPSEDKFRKVPLSSQALQTKVWRVKGAREFLESVGWRKEGDHLVFPVDASLLDLEMARQLLGGSSARHEDLKRHERAEKARILREEEQRKRDEIMHRASDSRKDSRPLVQRDSKSQLKGGTPNINNFKSMGMDLDSGGK